MKFLAPIAFRLAEAKERLAEQVDRVLRNHDERIRELVAVSILRGKLIVDTDVTTSGTDVVHGLGRTPVGCIVLKSDAAVTYKKDDFNPKTITVTSSSGTRTVSLWIF